MRAFTTSICGLAVCLVSNLALAQTSPAPSPTTSPKAIDEQPEHQAEPAQQSVPLAEPVAAEPVAPVASSPSPDPTASYEAAAPADPAPNAPHTPQPLVEEPAKPDHQNAKFYFGVQWDTAIGVGSTYQFINTFEPAGFAFEARYMGLGKLGVGLLISNQFMTVKGDHEVVRDNITLSGTQVRSLSISPLLARIHYSLRDIRKHESRKKIAPYAAFGFGGARVFRRLDMGISSYSLESWHWAFSPELGIQLPGDRMALTLSSRFNYLTASDGGPEQLYFNFSLGGGFF